MGHVRPSDESDVEAIASLPRDPLGDLGVAICRQHDVAEVCNPPRLVPTCNALGLTHSLSADLTTGYDFLENATKKASRTICVTTSEM